MKDSDDGFNGFGEVYFSNIDHNVIKGWKQHKIMQMNLVVPVGEVRFVVYDDREGSSTYGVFNDIYLSRNNYQRLTIPSGLWMAFQGRSLGGAMLMNTASIVHEPAESNVKNLNEIEYKWELA